MFFFSLGFLLVVIYNLLFELFFFKNSMMLDINCFLVCNLNFSHQNCSLAKFFLGLTSLFGLQIFNLL